MTLSKAQRLRNKVAILTRHHPNSSELLEARRDLAAARLENYISNAIVNEPALTGPQLGELATILLPGATE